MMNQMKVPSLAVVAVSAFLACGQATAALLGATSNGGDVPLSPSGLPDYVAPTYSGTRDGGTGIVTGTWASPAATPWIGSFDFISDIPATDATTNLLGLPAGHFGGTVSYDFNSMGAAGLPANTYFVFSDVDGGSGSGEAYRFRAFGADNVLITSPWLNETVAVWGNEGVGDPTAMPDWTGITSPAYIRSLAMVRLTRATLMSRSRSRTSTRFTDWNWRKTVPITVSVWRHPRR